MSPIEIRYTVYCIKRLDGCLAGCVLVSAVWFDPKEIPADLLCGLDDSKRLTAKMRDRLAVEI